MLSRAASRNPYPFDDAKRDLEELREQLDARPQRDSVSMPRRLAVALVALASASVLPSTVPSRAEGRQR